VRGLNFLRKHSGFCGLGLKIILSISSFFSVSVFLTNLNTGDNIILCKTEDEITDIQINN